jgi:hypothetical protein
VPKQPELKSQSLCILQGYLRLLYLRYILFRQSKNNKQAKIAYTA